MSKKIIIYTLLFFLSFGSMQTFAAYLYVTENNTKVFLNPSSSHKYLFWEWYRVSEANSSVWDLREVYLTDWKKAYIKNDKLSSYIDDKYILKSKTATLLAEKFPLFTTPNPEWDAKKIIYRWKKVKILSSNLINKIWVRVSDYKWNTGYLWYKTLNFSDSSDNLKKSMNLATTEQNSNDFFNQTDIFNLWNFTGNNTNNSDFSNPFGMLWGSLNPSYDISYELQKAKNNNPTAYDSFLQKVRNLKNTNFRTYNSIVNALKNKAPWVYNDLLLENNNQNNDDFTNDFLNNLINPTNNSIKNPQNQNDIKPNNPKPNNIEDDTQSEIEELENLSTEDLLNELFK